MYFTVSSSFLISFIMGGSDPSRVMDRYPLVRPPTPGMSWLRLAMHSIANQSEIKEREIGTSPAGIAVL